MPRPTAVPSYKVIEIDAKTNPKGIVRLISADKTSLPFIHKKYIPKTKIRKFVDSLHASWTRACESQSGFNKCEELTSTIMGRTPPATKHRVVRYLVTFKFTFKAFTALFGKLVSCLCLGFNFIALFLT